MGEGAHVVCDVNECHLGLGHAPKLTPCLDLRASACLEGGLSPPEPEAEEGRSRKDPLGVLHVMKPPSAGKPPPSERGKPSRYSPRANRPPQNERERPPFPIGTAFIVESENALAGGVELLRQNDGRPKNHRRKHWTSTLPSLRKDTRYLEGRSKRVGHFTFSLAARIGGFAISLAARVGSFVISLASVASPSSPPLASAATRSHSPLPSVALQSRSPLAPSESETSVDPGEEPSKIEIHQNLASQDVAFLVATIGSEQGEPERLNNSSILPAGGPATLQPVEARWGVEAEPQPEESTTKPRTACCFFETLVVAPE